VIEGFAALTGASDRVKKLTKDVIDEIADIDGFAKDLGQWSEVRASEEYVLRAQWILLGDDDHATIGAMSNFASTLGEQGHLEEAARMKREVL
jgi:hypothetical protein